jgi:phosphoglycerate dehydrogenase-like enzyme
MFTRVTEKTRQTISAAAAVAVVAFAGLTLDQGHLSALPQGSVEVGELTPVNLMQMAAVTLPEILVTARRVEESRHSAGLTQLPEVVVIGSREVQLAAVPASEPTQG